MKYISEDNRRHSPVSILVDGIYGFENTIYSCGNSNLYRYINKYKDSLEEVIVYIDLVPGNLETYRVFRNLIKMYSKYKNIYIVPILSTEACIVKSLIMLESNINTEIEKILLGKISYKNTKYSFCSNLEKVTKEFYKDIEILKNDLSYYTDDYVFIGNLNVSKELRGVYFIISHDCYLPNKVILKYFKGQNISLCEYIDIYISYFNKLAKINNLPEFPKNFNYRKYLQDR